MASDQESYEARMQKSLGQYQDWNAQGKSVTNNPEQQPAPSPPPRYDAQVSQDTANRINDGQTMGENGNWQQQPTPANDRAESAGQVLQQHSVTMDGERLSPDSAAHMQNRLDNSQQPSGNEPTQGNVSRTEAARETAKNSPPSPETNSPSMEK